MLARSRRILRLVVLVFVLACFFSGNLRDLLQVLIVHRQANVVRRIPVSNLKLPLPKDPDINPQKALGSHHFRSDGLLVVNSDGSHPIYELITRAENAWNTKLRHASKSFDQAVVEYRRRYHREPPRGFDDWWQYVKEHDVPLPDEYDQIYHDLEPYWGIEPADLLDIRSELESKIDSYTLGKTSTSGISVVNTSFEAGRYNQLIKGSETIVDLLEDVREFLPPFRAVFSPHDGPNRLSDYAVKSATLKAAATRKYIKRTSLPPINSIGWVSACSPTSPARRRLINLDNPPPPPSKKTFIFNHHLAMDPCLHPEHLFHHGQFLSHDMGPTPQHAMVPEFSYCSTTIHHNIRLPTPYGWIEDIYPRTDDPEWDDKLDERLLWRGSNTGMFHADHTRWHGSHRDHLVRLANELNGTVKLLPPRPKSESVGEGTEVRKARLNPAIMDIAFAGDPIACDPKTCDFLEEIFPWRQWQSVKEAGNYKYVLDVDGNGWSGRFKRLITSNSLVFKSTIYPEWYTDRIQPWVHYIPIQLDLSDLHDALVFFRGDANGEGAHEHLARKIAMAGRKWSKTFWRREDMVAYFFRLLLEYTRLMSLDREAMSYSGLK